MFALKTPKQFAIGLLALASLAFTAGTSRADQIINFIELPNEGGIHMIASGSSSAAVTIPGETFHISSPNVPAGYTPDAIVSHIGITRSGVNSYLVNILESPGGPISDQVHIYQFVPLFTVIDFLSDPNDFVAGLADATVVEDGTLQHVFDYFNDRGELVSINVQSDVEVPEPASLILLGSALLGFAARRRRYRA